MLYLPAIFFAVFWIWSDLIGVLLSVISTYFYFGWEGVPLLVPKIFSIALLTFSAPAAYRLLLKRFNPETLQRGLLLMLFFLYLGLAVNRQSDFFAWTTVAAAWVGGLTMMAILRTLGRWPIWSMPLYALVLSTFFYLATRISQAGLPLLLSSPQSMGMMGWGTLSVFVLAGVFLPARRQSEPEPAATSPLPRFAGSLGLVFGLLTGLSVGLVANLHLWSAKTEPMPAAVYFLPFASGVLLAWGAYRFGQKQRLAVLTLALLALGGGLVPLLYTGYDLKLGLLACLGASFGLFSFWANFLGRWRLYLRQQPEFFPWLGLQGGFVGLLLILAVFLLKANPGGFWLALLGAGALLLAHEAAGAPQELGKTPLDRLWLYSCGVFAIMGLVVLVLPMRPTNIEIPRGAIRIISSNIRYGWTDDYRYDPFVHPRWLKNRLPGLLGLEEVNKGHTSGAYSDLFSLYKHMLTGGRWIYGDAHYGFGNALYSRYPVVSTEVRTYQAKDMLKRSCLIATVTINGRPVDVYVTHLSHLDPPNPVREAQAAELAGWLKAETKPWIVIGDFNATPDSGEVKAIEAVAHPLFHDHPAFLRVNSFPSLKPTRRIDYIFFSKDFEMLHTQVLENNGTSDHRPVETELALKKQGKP